jgi:hypothetical protein
MNAEPLAQRGVSRTRETEMSVLLPIVMIVLSAVMIVAAVFLFSLSIGRHLLQAVQLITVVANFGLIIFEINLILRAVS